MSKLYVKMSLACVCILLLAQLAACSNESAGAKHTVVFLSSDELAGRLVGTAENAQAVDYIKSSFAESGLEPFDGDDFGFAYSQKDVYLPESLTLEVELWTDGTWSELVPGEDFLPRLSYADIQGEYDILRSEADGDVSVSAFLLKEDENIYGMESTPALALIYGDMMITRPESGSHSIALTPTGYEKAENAQKIRLDIRTPMSTVDVENVIGVLPGQDSSRAVLVSAHFDHVGRIGDTVFPGGHDNASGIAVMLEMAKALSNASEKPPVDIVFCAFNGEENAQQGSAAFAPKVASRYDSYWVLNIDCVGSPNEPQSYIVVAQLPEDPLATQLKSALNDSGLSADDGVMQSDHLAFSYSKFSAITVGQDTREIHVPGDDGKDLNFDEMEKLTELLCSFILNNSETEFVAPKEPPAGAFAPISQAELYARAEELLAGRSLAYDEAIYFQAGDMSYQVAGARLLTDLDEINRYHGELKIQESFVGLPLEFVVYTQDISLFTDFYTFDYLQPTMCMNYKPEVLDSIAKRSLDLSFDGYENSNILAIRYRTENRIITMYVSNPRVNIMEPMFDEKEDLKDAYTGFTIYASTDEIETYYTCIRYTPADQSFALYVDVKDVIDIETSTGGISKDVRINKGNNTRDDMLAIIDLIIDKLEKS